MRLSLILSKLYRENESLRNEKRKTKGDKNAGIVALMWFGGHINELLGLDIERVENNSKCANEKSIFVCVRGEKFDGNDFLNEAEMKSTRVFVTERDDLQINQGIIIIVKNARKFLAELCKILYAFPQSDMKIVGITGTKGKSTVVSLAFQTLQKFGIKALSIGTLGVNGIEAPEIINTTPDSVVIFPLLKRAYQEGVRVVLIEVSSQALKEFRVWGIDFDIVAFTSLGNDHVGHGEHESFSDYLSCKRSLFTSYGAKIAVVNFDDPYSAFFSSGVDKVVRVGHTPHSDYLISDVTFDFSGMRYTISGFSSTSFLPGFFNATNIAISLAIIREISALSIDDILDVISQVKVPGRFEYYNLHGRFFVIDYAHNEKSFCEVIALVKQITSGQIITVFGSVGGRSQQRRKGLAGAAEQFADFSVITSDNPNYEDPYSIAYDIYSSFRDKSRAKIVIDRREAIKFAVSKSSPNDAILLLGKGHEEFMLVRGKRYPFSEREILDTLDKDFNLW